MLIICLSLLVFVYVQFVLFTLYIGILLFSNSNFVAAVFCWFLSHCWCGFGMMEIGPVRNLLLRSPNVLS